MNWIINCYRYIFIYVNTRSASDSFPYISYFTKSCYLETTFIARSVTLFLLRMSDKTASFFAMRWDCFCGTVADNGSHCPCPTWYMSECGTVKWCRQGNRKFSENNLLQCQFVHKNPTWTAVLMAKPGLRGQTPATGHWYLYTHVTSWYIFCSFYTLNFYWCYCTGLYV